MQEAFDWNEEPPLDPAIEYQGLLRGLRRKKGFGLYFVQCSLSEGTRLIEQIRQDLPQKIEVLKFDAPMDGNFYQCVADYLQAHDDTEILFVQGLEYLLLSYEATKREDGWSSEEIYSYSWKAVPRLLGNLNLQRERFRDNLPIRFVFLLPSFAMKYLIRRAPDFFDWRSGLFDFAMGAEDVQEASQRVYLERGEWEDLSELTKQELQKRLLAVETLLEELNQADKDKANLLFQRGRLLGVYKDYEAEIISYDRALALNSDDHQAWYNRGVALSNLGRYEEAIASYDRALVIKPDKVEALSSQGIALRKLGQVEEAISVYDQALKLKPDYYEVWYNRGLALVGLGRVEEAISSFNRAVEINPSYAAAFYNNACIYALQENTGQSVENLRRAIRISPDKYQGAAKEDMDFEKIRNHPEFIVLLGKN